MNKIIYYHYFCTDKSFDILSRTLDEIIKSDLYENINKLHINIVGENVQDHINSIQTKFADKLAKINLHQYINQELREYMDSFTPSEIKHNYRLSIGRAGLELDTLKLIQNQIHALKNPSNILYIHGKGSVHSGAHKGAQFKSREDWRLEMSNTVIRNWRKCQKDLKTKPHIGPKLCKNHYSGNFWWSTSEHIKSLQCPIEFAKSNKFSEGKLKGCSSWIAQSPYYSAEFWLFSNLKNV